MTSKETLVHTEKENHDARNLNILPCCGDRTQPIHKTYAVERLVAAGIITCIVSPGSTLISELIIYIETAKSMAEKPW